jgi:multiple sugar transport system substrate-binding protein
MSDGKNQQVSRRQFLKAAGLASSGLLLASCAPATPTTGPRDATEAAGGAAPAKEPVTIRFTSEMTPQTFVPFVPDLAKERLEGMIVEVDQTPAGGSWAGYSDNIITRIAGGEQIDLIHMAIEGTALLTKKKVIVPLDNYIAADAEAKADWDKDVHPRLMEIMKVDGKQMELPFGYNNMIIHYNYKMLEEMGVPEPGEDWTWDDFLEVCKTLADVQGKENDRYGYSFWGGAAFSMAPWFFSNGTSYLTEDWKDSNLQDPKVIETVQFLADLIHKHKVAPVPMGWDEWGQFHARHLAMRSCGGWCIRGANTSEFYDYKFQYQPTNGGKYKTVVGVHGYGMMTMSQHKDEAWQALSKVLMSKETIENYTVVDGSPPARESVASSQVVLDKAKPSPADMRIFWDSLDYAQVVPSPPNFNAIDPILIRWYQQLWSGEISAEEAMKSAHVDLQAEMDKLKS